MNSDRTQWRWRFKIHLALGLDIVVSKQNLSLDYVEGEVVKRGQVPGLWRIIAPSEHCVRAEDKENKTLSS